MAITFTEYSINDDHALFSTNFASAATSQIQMFTEPLSAFGVVATHSTTGTFGCTLQGTVDGTVFIDLQVLTNTDLTTFVTGKPCRGIRHVVGSMASSGTVQFTTISRDSA